MGETRKPCRWTERNTRKVVGFNGEPAERKPTDEEGELRVGSMPFTIIPVNPACEGLHAGACGEYAASGRAVYVNS